MTNRIEAAASAEAERRYPDFPTADLHSAGYWAFQGSANFLSKWLESPENVERAARAIRDTRFNARLPHTGAPMWTDEDLARAALRALIEGEGS